MEKRYCNKCGALLNKDGSCSNCDKYRLKKQAKVICDGCGTEVYYDDFDINKNRKVRIVRCNKCNKLLKGKKIVLARNVLISGIAIIFICVGLVIGESRKIGKDKEVKTSYVKNEEVLQDKEIKRRGMLENALKTYEIQYETQFRDEKSDINVTGSKNGDLLEIAREEMSYLKSKGVKDINYSSTYILEDEYSEITNRGKSIVNISAYLTMQDSSEKKAYDRKLEVNYEIASGGFVIDILNYKVLEESKI